MFFQIYSFTFNTKLPTNPIAANNMLTYLIGNTINQSFFINPDTASSLFVTCVKFMVTRKLLEMDATLLANTYLFATGEVNRFEISDRMSLSQLAEFDGITDVTLKTSLKVMGSIGIPIMTLLLITNSTNLNAIIPI